MESGNKKSYPNLVNIYTDTSNTPRTMVNANLNMPRSLDLVKDPYTGKYYGDYSYEDMRRYVAAYQSQQSQELRDASVMGMADVATQMLGSPQQKPGVGKLGQERSGEPVVEKGFTFDGRDGVLGSISKDNYIQWDRVTDSYKAYGGDWDEYFKRNYQNPRISEENKNKAANARDTNRQRENWWNSMQELTIQASSMPSSKKTRNTGINSRSDIFRGGLEAGLGV